MHFCHKLICLDPFFSFFCFNEEVILTKYLVMVQAKTWTLTKPFEGFPKDSNFELKVEELPDPKDGGKVISKQNQKKPLD